MKLKVNCILKDLQPPIIVALIVADDIYRASGFDMTVTSINDSKHSDDSFHYKGLAVDLRIRDVPTEKVDSIFKQLRAALTIEFDVIKEIDHIHIEYDPKLIGDTPIKPLKRDLIDPIQTSQD